jgi:hypothetical protein
MPITDDAFWNALYAIGTEDQHPTSCPRIGVSRVMNVEPKSVCVRLNPYLTDFESLAFRRARPQSERRRQ